MPAQPAGPNARHLFVGLCGLALLGACEVSTTGSDPGGGTGGVKQVLFELALRADLANGSTDDGLADSLARDLDGDGKLEWIQALAQTNEVKIAWAAGFAGPPSAAAVQTLELPGRPLRLATGDFDGDGRLGLAVLVRISGGPGDTHISVYEQTGGGGLGLRASALLTGFAVRIAAGPLLGPGHADRLVVPLPETSVVQLLRLEGSALQLENVLTFPLAAGPLDVALLTPDQLPLGLPWPALVVSERGLAVGQARVQWFKPSAPLVYASAGVLAGGLGLALLPEPSDTDGDGLADLLICDVLGGSQGLYRCFGQAQGLGPAALVPGISNPSDACAVGLGGSGANDLYAADPFTLTLRRLPAMPGGGFGPVEIYLSPRTCLRLDRPKMPLAPCLLSVGSEAAEWVHGTSLPGRPAAARGYPAGGVPVQFELGHFDQDGFADAMVLDLLGAQLIPLRGTAQLGNFPGGFRSADLDADGDLDVIVALKQGQRLATFRNDGNFAFTPGPDFKLAGAPLDIELFDLDQDGLLDVAVSVPLTNQLLLLRGQPNLHFSPWAEIPLPKRPLALHSVDLNGDPRPELVISSAEVDGRAPALLLFRAVETGPYPLELSFVQELPGVGIEISSGDLNADDRPDLLITQIGPGVLHVPVFLSTPDPTDFQLVTVPIGAQPGAARMVDLDLDGHLDLVAALTSGQMAWARGNGQGDFSVQTGQPYSLPNGCTALRFKDLDQDGRPEVLCVSPQSGHLWVGRNVSE
jgi:FG-GAP-like repeat